MKIISKYNKFDQFRTLLQVSTSCPAQNWLHPLELTPPPDYRLLPLSSDSSNCELAPPTVSWLLP